MIDLTKLGQATVINRNNNKPDALHMITPINIVSDMVDLLDSSSWTKDTKFIDIACKSGNFLREIYVRLMNCSNLIREFPDRVYRSEWILNNQLYGIAFSELDAAISIRNVYGIYTSTSNIKYMPNYMDLVKRNRVIERIKETFGIMKFDVVIGNPPYNNDIYIDFVLMSKQLTRGQGNICMITPAKWQAKGGEKNELFRREIVPYMSDIVYYKDSTDVFDIYEWGGICHFVSDADVHTVKNVKTLCSKHSGLESPYEEHDEVDVLLLSRNVLRIIGKVGTLGYGFKQSVHINSNNCKEKTLADIVCDGFKQSLYVKNTDHGEMYMDTERRAEYVSVMQGDKVCGYKRVRELFTTEQLDKYKCIISVMTGGCLIPDDDGKILGITKISIISPNQVPKGSFLTLKYFDTKSESESFVSYCNTKIVNFLYYLGCCGTTLTREFFRFIPCPEKFDHIFTDEELYKKYNLTQEEIELIESVIKERK